MRIILCAAQTSIVTRATADVCAMVREDIGHDGAAVAIPRWIGYADDTFAERHALGDVRGPHAVLSDTLCGWPADVVAAVLLRVGTILRRYAALHLLP